MNYDLLNTTTPTKMYAMTSLELPQNVRNGNSGNVLKGYFKAPATGNYRFYMACDDKCYLKFSNVSMDPSQAVSILNQDSYTSYRNYINDTRYTDWISLEKDGYYYLEAAHIQYSGNDHLTISVESDANDIVGHMYSRREVQRLQILPELKRDTFYLDIEKPWPGRCFSLFFDMSGKTGVPGVWWYSREWTCNSTIADLQYGFGEFYKFCFDIPVTIK